MQQLKQLSHSQFFPPDSGLLACCYKRNRWEARPQLAVSRCLKRYRSVNSQRLMAQCHLIRTELEWKPCMHDIAQFVLEDASGMAMIGCRSVMNLRLREPSSLSPLLGTPAAFSCLSTRLPAQSFRNLRRIGAKGCWLSIVTAPAQHTQNTCTWAHSQA